MEVKEYVTPIAYRVKSADDTIKVYQVNTGDSPCSKYYENTVTQKMNIFLRSSYFGIFCAFLAGVFFTLAVVVVQKTTHCDPIHQFSIMSLCFIVGPAPVLVFTGRKVFGPSQQQLFCFLRAAFGTAGLLLSYLSSRHLPLLDMAIFFSTMPGLSALAARIFLKEKCGFLLMVSLALTAVGVLLVGRFPDLLAHTSGERFTNEYITGYVCAIGCVLCMASANTLVRAMKEDHHYAVQLFHMGLIGLLPGGCLLVAFATDLPRCGWDRLLILSGGVAYLAANCCVTLSMQTEAVAIATSIIGCTEVVAALLINLIFFQRFPEAYDWSGSGVVLVSACIVGWIKWRRQRVEPGKWA